MSSSVQKVIQLTTPKGSAIKMGNDLPFVLFGGMNVLESRDMAMTIAEKYIEVTEKLGIPYVFKASFDKANRSSVSSFRGPGLDEGLKIFQEIKATFDVPIITDVHEPHQAKPVAEVCDIIQLPAFLSRQTDLVVAMAQTGAIINVKKAQFLAPREMKHIIRKCEEAGNSEVILCERGSSFGYNNLVSDMRSLAVMRGTNCPVVFDATHSVQLPGGKGSASGGQREFIPVLARAATAVGIAGLFMETHPEPEKALSDGPNAWPLARMQELLETLVAIDNTVKKEAYAEESLGLSFAE